MTDQPLVSVVMPVYNASPYLTQSMQSILNQTYANFEFIIIDDGSTDDSLKVIEKYTDRRIQVYQHSQNQGVIAALNQGFGMAKGKYIARMDADDYCEITRFEKQVYLMEAQPDIDLCGTWVAYVSQHSKTTTQLPVNSEAIKAFLLWGNSIMHATTMFRRSFLLKHHLKFEQGFVHAEDYDLWTRCLAIAQFINIPEVLYHIRQNNQQVSVRFKALQIKNTQLIHQRQLQTLGINPTPQELDLHYTCTRSELSQSVETLQQLSGWLLKLHRQNRAKPIYPEPAFTNLLKSIWSKHTAGQTHLGKRFFQLIGQNQLSPYHQWSHWQRFRFWLKSMLRL
ncbi:glycosyltransferase family A protein [uncultured Microscilla sp.]|uniref:glycosyltransferase family 2 protein n=1 Tax=uncultured Microscilla sp. TaxID=432653 RepID=UPI00261AF060|nr:glycosyltransferase family A protein [uncultured Microscilla sp.]